MVVKEERSSHRSESMVLAKEHVLKPRLNMCFTGVKTTRQIESLSSFVFAPGVTCAQQRNDVPLAIAPC